MITVSGRILKYLRMVRNSPPKETYTRLWRDLSSRKPSRVTTQVSSPTVRLDLAKLTGDCHWLRFSILITFFNCGYQIELADLGRNSSCLTSDHFFSMMGVPEDPGIIPRFAEDLFRRIELSTRKNTPSLHVNDLFVCIGRYIGTQE